nr:type II toxin-antitoxin system prevent-host-death family antitoxin [Kingella kingae]
MQAALSYEKQPAHSQQYFFGRPIMQAVLADYAVSVAELKRNYASIIDEATGAVAVLNHNKPEAYLIPAQHYEQLMDYLEDLQDAQIIQERINSPSREVSLDEL